MAELWDVYDKKFNKIENTTLVRGGTMTFFHASQTKNIKILKPNISNHNIPLIYFSDKRVNVLVY